MKTFIEKTSDLKSYYNKLLAYVEKIPKQDIYSKIDENLLVHKKGDRLQYWISYKKFGEQRKRIYIPRSDIEKIDSLAKKKYLASIENMLRKRIKLLDKVLKEFQRPSLDQLYESLHLPENTSVKPIIPTNKQIYESWLDEEYELLNINPDESYKTGKGVYVRSKSEKIIADKLTHYGIEYKYEAPLLIKGKSYRPDFTIFSNKLGRKIYWEHMGLIGTENYEKKNFTKLNSYILDGLTLGENLIITFESPYIKLNDEVIEYFIKEYFL